MLLRNLARNSNESSGLEGTPLLNSNLNPITHRRKLSLYSVFFVLLLKTVGRITATLPESAVKVISYFGGCLIYIFLRSRRHVIFSNLHHAFPDRPEVWRQKIARLTCNRTAEMGLFILASPFFSRSRAEKILTLSEAAREAIEELEAKNRGGIALVPHFILMEVLTYIPLLHAHFPPLGDIYRPLDNRHLDAWIKRTRERFGAKLLSRKKGYSSAVTMIRKGGWVSIPFDQNAGDVGSLITSFGRVASATHLPQILFHNLKVPAAITFPRRISFWRAELHLEILARADEEVNLTLAANRWLENYLRSHEDQIANWFWIHRRWNNQVAPARRLRLQNRRNLLEEDRTERGWEELPRDTRFWIRTPNWLGDLAMMIPLLRAIRKGRPDAALTLLAQPRYIPFLQATGLGEDFIALPRSRNPLSYFLSFLRFRKAYPDTILLFTNSISGDLEAWLTGCPQRFGIQRSGKMRPLLSNVWKIPAELDEDEVHQTQVWESYLRHFGLNEEIRKSPVRFECDSGPEFNQQREAPNIGLICGSENQPAKRWPVGHWRKLVESLTTRYTDMHINLFGSPSDQVVTEVVAQGFPCQRMSNFAGKTDLLEFARRLSRCSIVVSNDTGGMHLANSLGVPIVGIFGPTNPIRTGPIFDAPSRIIQPPGCPSTGGMPINQVSPDAVLRAVEDLL